MQDTKAKNYAGKVTGKRFRRGKVRKVFVFVLTWGNMTNSLP